MINYYQPENGPFSSNKKSPNNFEYYWSFEDALWDVLQTVFGNKKVKFLVPDFYCSDVLDNIVAHGHSYSYYRLDKYLNISFENLKTYIEQTQPEIIIIFHPAGLDRSLLVKEICKWNSNLLIIEDAVHRLIDPNEVKIYGKNHVVIDSLRKVSPFPGSRVWGDKGLLNSLPDKKSRKNIYTLASEWLYKIFRVVLNFGFKNDSEKIVTFAHKKILKWHDDIIGNSKQGFRGSDKIRQLIDKIHYEKIREIKFKQIRAYELHLGDVFKMTDFYQIPVSKQEAGEMHVYPLGYEKAANKQLEKYLAKTNMAVWFKFTDMPWSEKKSVLFLPLGPHISNDDISKLTDMLRSWV